jgi:hypothetical protein
VNIRHPSTHQYDIQIQKVHNLFGSTLVFGFPNPFLTFSLFLYVILVVTACSTFTGFLFDAAISNIRQSSGFFLPLPSTQEVVVLRLYCIHGPWVLVLRCSTRHPLFPRFLILPHSTLLNSPSRMPEPTYSRQTICIFTSLR